MTAAEYRERWDALVKYLRVKTDELDWHGVSDAANDLRVLEARRPDLQTERHEFQPLGNYRPWTPSRNWTIEGDGTHESGSAT